MSERDWGAEYDPSDEPGGHPFYRRALMRAPDCRDPAHPGCDKCEDEED